MTRDDLAELDAWLDKEYPVRYYNEWPDFWDGERPKIRPKAPPKKRPDLSFCQLDDDLADGLGSGEEAEKWLVAERQ